MIVFDADRQAIRARIPVGAGPRNLDLTPDGSRLYVANSDDFSLSVINPDTGKEVQRLRLPSLYPNPVLPDQFNVKPYKIAVISDTLALIGGDPNLASGGPLYKLHLQTAQLTPLAVPQAYTQGTRPVMTHSHDGSAVLIVMEPGSSPTSIVRYSVAKDRFVSPANGIERSIAISPDGQRAVSTFYDCNKAISNYTVYDAQLATTETIKALGCQTTGVVFSPTSPTTLYGLDDRAVAIDVVDIAQHRQLRTIRFPFSTVQPGDGTYFFQAIGRAAVISGDGRWLYIPLLQVNNAPPSRLLAVYVGPAAQVALPAIQR